MSLEILNNPLLGNPVNSFFKNKEPKFPSSSVIASPSEFKQLTARQIANTYYNGRPVLEGDGFQIFSDEPVFGGNIEEVVVYKSRFSQMIGGIDVVLFASKNGAFLLQRYMEALPSSKQLILFLEINDEYNYSTVMRIVAGADLTKNKDLPFNDILTFTRKHEVAVSPKALEDLIKNGIYRNKVGFVSWLLGLKDASVGQIFSFFKQEILEGAAHFFIEGIADNVAKLRISENGWNPDAKEGEYDPALIPDVLYEELKKFYEHTTPGNPYENLEGQKKINSRIIKSLFERINGVKSDFNNLLSNGENFFPAFIFKKIKQSLNLFFKQIDKIEEFLIDPLTGMQHIIYRSHQITNAFLCGIYNSLIDIIAGIFSIVGFIFKAVAAMDKVNDRKVEYGEMFLELMEDLMEGIMKFDYVDFLKQCVTFQIRTIIRLVMWVDEKVPQFTLEKAAYYYGYIIGIIIDIIVETLLTGGAAAVAKLAKTVESFILNPLEKISKVITQAGNFLTRIMEFISMLLREFKKGTKEIFSKLGKVLDEVFGFGDEVADHALTPAEKRVKEKNRRRQEKLDRKKRTRKGKYNLDEVDALGSRPATNEELLEWEKKIKILAFKEKGRFRMATKNTPAFRYMERYKVAAYFDAHEIPPIIWYREGSSNYVIAHEYYHLEEFCKIGKKDFIKGDLGTLKEWHRNNIMREKYVAEKLLENAEILNLSLNELTHIKWYYQKKIIQPAVNDGVE
ncbi:MAG: hypothetical protein L0G07_00155, partial [Chryseobacterium sp.]|nr:hypothetical protein [Chryseobacterium sp.]MDN5421797.1 hypothetical protein [Chryseobacterium sp.]